MYTGTDQDVLFSLSSFSCSKSDQKGVFYESDGAEGDSFFKSVWPIHLSEKLPGDRLQLPLPLTQTVLI